MALLKQSTAVVVCFPVVSSTDHLAALTGATVTVTISKNGGAFAAAGGTVAEIANGWYKISLTTTDTNTLGDLAFHCTATGADPTQFKEQVVAFDPTSATSLGLSNLDATVSSRLATAGYTAPPSAASISTTVWAEATRSLTDKAGFALSAAGVQAIWDALTTALTTAGSIGKRLADDVDATISSRLATAGYTAPDNASITTLTGRLTAGRATNLDNLDAAVSSRSSHTAADVWASGTRTLTGAVDILQSAADKVWSTAARTLTAFGFSVTVGTNNDKTGYSLSTTPPTAAQVSTQVWSEAIPGAFGAGTAAARLNAATAPTAAAVADAVWDEALSGHLTAGSTGEKLNAAGASSSLGAGALTHTHTVYEPGGVIPASDVDVWATTDAAGTNVVASSKTDAFGQVRFFLDAGTYYLFRQRAGTNFANPVTVVVS